MTEIVPAILAGSLKEIEAQLKRVRGAAKRVQIDVVDGRFARTKGWHGTTWPYRDAGSYAALLADERGLPLWDEFDFEFDLMVEEPKAKALEMAQAMASRIIIHGRAPGALEALRALADLKRDDYGEYTVVTGVAVGPGEQPEFLNEFEGFYDFVQVMGIARVGRQGQPPDPRARFLVERLHARNPGLFIQVDGAVGHENARALAQAGAGALIAGHIIWEADDPKAELALLAAAANAA